ncbi:Uncharacterised protein [Slackia heliotrinireducens]|nr:Uncharacterised protein [Slackia heliotrinireducens]
MTLRGGTATDILPASSPHVRQYATGCSRGISVAVPPLAVSPWAFRNKRRPSRRGAVASQSAPLHCLARGDRPAGALLLRKARPFTALIGEGRPAGALFAFGKSTPLWCLARGGRPVGALLLRKARPFGVPIAEGCSVRRGCSGGVGSLRCVPSGTVLCQKDASLVTHGAIPSCRFRKGACIRRSLRLPFPRTV